MGFRNKRNADSEGATDNSIPSATNNSETITPAPEEAERESPFKTEVGTGEGNDIRLQLQEAKSEAARNMDALLRLKAEFENFKKRKAKEQSQLTAFVREGIFSELLRFADALEQASETIQNTRDVNAIQDGMGLIVKQFREFLKSQGISKVQSIGEPFDPSVHEALLMVDVPDAEPNTIAYEIQPGYTLGERILRTAKVAVVKTSEANDEKRTKS